MPMGLLVLGHGRSSRPISHCACPLRRKRGAIMPCPSTRVEP